jgi:hypothetical protein
VFTFGAGRSDGFAQLRFEEDVEVGEVMVDQVGGMLESQSTRWNHWHDWVVYVKRSGSEGRSWKEDSERERE